MNNKKLLNRFENVDRDTEYLVCGYIHIATKNHNIPSVIIQLCIKFYFMSYSIYIFVPFIFHNVIYYFLYI